MKNQRISFRLSPYHIARGLQIVKQLEPNYKLTSINDLVKIIYHDYLAKMNLGKSDQVPLEVMAEVMDFINKKETKAESGDLTVSDLMVLTNQESTPAQTTTQVHETIPVREDLQATSPSFEDTANQQAYANAPSEFNDPNESDSDISSVSDFSPPSDWK